MYQEIIKVSVYKCSESDTNFKQADKTYIGSIFVMWKECVERENNGASDWIHFQEELRDPEEKCTVDLTGMFVGQVKWIKFGHADSSYNAEGEKKAAPKVQKTADDFRGKQIGEGGTLSVMPKMYTHPTDLSLETAYQVHFQLFTQDGNEVGETLSVATNNKLSINNPKVFKWASTKTIAVTDHLSDVVLVMTIQTEQHGITAGTPIARGQVNLNEVLYNNDKDAKGEYRIKIETVLKLCDSPDIASTFAVLLRYSPPEKAIVAAAIQEETKVPEQI